MTERVVRPARPDEAGLLHEIASQTFALACPPGTTDENIQAFIAQNLSQEAFTRYLASARHHLWLAWDGESVVGYAMAVTGEPDDPAVREALNGRPTVELSKIYVSVDAQGSGVSTDLLREVELFAVSTGAESVWLGVNQFNERANRFYEGAGFTVVGTRKFLVGDSFESDFIREKDLTAPNE